MIGAWRWRSIELCRGKNVRRSKKHDLRSLKTSTRSVEKHRKRQRATLRNTTKLLLNSLLLDHSLALTSTQSVPLVTRKMSLVSRAYSSWLKRSLNLRSNPLTILASVRRASSCAKACRIRQRAARLRSGEGTHLSRAQVGAEREGEVGRKVVDERIGGVRRRERVIGEPAFGKEDFGRGREVGGVSLDCVGWLQKARQKEPRARGRKRARLRRWCQRGCIARRFESLRFRLNAALRKGREEECEGLRRCKHWRERLVS